MSFAINSHSRPNGFSTVSTNHAFYRNLKANNVKPPWFINCNRIQAEDILKTYNDYGNVLIRPNSSFSTNGSYALSALTRIHGVLKFNHYIISRGSAGFSLDVQSKPAPMSCLQDVLEYYLTAAGTHTHSAMVLDPTDIESVRRPSNGKQKGSDYVNIPETIGFRSSNPLPESTYMQMNGSAANKNSHSIGRRSSEPVKRNQDYVNIAKTTRGQDASEIYLNVSEVEKEAPKGQRTREYVNIASVLPGHSTSVLPGRSKSMKSVPKSNSFPEYGKGKGKSDGSDNDDYEVPIFEEPVYLAPQQ